MRALAALFLVPLMACGGPDVDGSWKGDCNIQSGTVSSNLVMDLDLSADGDNVGGTGAITDDLYGAVDVAVEGSLDGKDILLALVFDLGLTLPGDTGGSTTGTDFDDMFDISYEIDATVKGDKMEGRCAIKVMGFGVGADIVLERQ